MDTKSVIAVLHKAAEAMESGEWRPDKELRSGMLFDIGEPLPSILQVAPLDMKRSAQQYPLDVAVDYRHDRMAGQSVRI